MESYEGLVDISKEHASYKNWSQSDVQYVAVVVGCELAVEDGSFVRLLKVEEGDCTLDCTISSSADSGHEVDEPSSE